MVGGLEKAVNAKVHPGKSSVANCDRSLVMGVIPKSRVFRAGYETSFCEFAKHGPGDLAARRDGQAESLHEKSWSPRPNRWGVGPQHGTHH